MRQNLLLIWMSIAGRLNFVIASQMPFQFPCSRLCAEKSKLAAYSSYIDRSMHVYTFNLVFLFWSYSLHFTMLPFNLRSSIQTITKSKAFFFVFRHIRIVKSSCLVSYYRIKHSDLLTERNETNTLNSTCFSIIFKRFFVATLYLITFSK